MSERIPQSVAKRVLLKAYLASDHLTPATGKTIAVTISKDGGAFGNPSGGATNATEISAGWYYVDLSTTDTGTLGPLQVRATNVDCDDIEPKTYSVASAHNAGFDGVPNAAAEAAGGVFTRGTGAGQINQETNGYISVNLKAILGTVLTETVGGYLAAAFKKLLDVATPVFTTASANQTGDSYPIVNSGTYGNSALNTAIASLLTAVNNLNNLSALANLRGAPILEIPDSSTTQFPFTLTVHDSEGHLVALDSDPTITAANAAGTDRSGNLSSIANPSTGVYTFTYGVSSAAAEEGLRIVATGAVSSSARRADYVGAVANYDSITTLNAIKTKTDLIPASPAAAGDCLTAVGVRDAIGLATANLDTQLATIATYAGNVSSRVTSTLFSGIASLANWLRAIARKENIDTATTNELNATTGSGTGTYDPTTDSQQAIRDRGDVAWGASGVFDPSTSESEPGVTWNEAMQVAVAALVGNATKTGRTFTFKNQAGEGVATVTESAEDLGARTDSEILHP